MAIRSTVSLEALADGLSFEVSVNVPSFREVQFLFIQQDDWWMLSIDGRDAFRLATFTTYNLDDFIDANLKFTFQLKPKNIINQTVEVDDIDQFYFVLFSGEDFDISTERMVDPVFIFDPESVPFEDILLNPLPSGFGPYAYLTFSHILHTNLDITGWENLIGDEWDVALNAVIGINDDFNINSNSVTDITTIKRNSNDDHNIESAPTCMIVFKPDFIATGVEYNILQLGTVNDVFISLKRIDATTIEYKASRNTSTTLQASYSTGQFLGVIVEMNKDVFDSQSIRASTGEFIRVNNNTIADADGSWGFFANAGRDLLRMQIIETLVLPAFQPISELNRVANYLNNKYSLSFPEFI